jgi:hypothetical protein
LRVNKLPFCNNCGTQLQNQTKFCPNCGASQQAYPQQPPQPTPAQITSVSESVETAYFKGEGELIVTKTEHRGAGRKVASLALGPVGYLAFGRDKNKKSKAKGTLVVTNEAIYCAGNDYPFDRIISITKQGTISKSVVLTFEKDVQVGGRAEGGALGVGRPVQRTRKSKNGRHKRPIKN